MSEMQVCETWCVDDFEKHLAESYNALLREWKEERYKALNKIMRYGNHRARRVAKAQVRNGTFMQFSPDFNPAGTSIKEIIDRALQQALNK